MLLGWAGVISLRWVLPPEYQSQALLLIEHQSVPQTYVQPNVTFNPSELLQSMGQEVLSHDRLAAVVRRHQLYPAIQKRQGMEAAILRLRSRIAIQPVSLDSLPLMPAGEWSAVGIAFTDSSAERAQQIDGELTTMFIQENLRSTQQASAQTTAFLEQQLQQAQDAVAQAQQKVQAYERSHLGVLPGQDQGNLAMVLNLQGELAQSLQARRQLQQEIATDRALLQQAPSPETSRLQQQLAALQAKARDLGTRYTDRYPDLQQVRQQIGDIQAQLAQAPKAEGSTAESTMALTQARSQLQADEAQLPHVQTQVANLQHQLDLYQHRLTLAPLPASELAALEAQQQQTQAAYQSVASKLDASQMASQLEQQQGGAQFRLVNSPDLPKQPVWPSPNALILIGIGAGLALGFGVCALAELGRDCISGEAELMQLGFTPILAFVPALGSRGERKRRRTQRTLEWIAAFAVVLILAAGNIWMWRLGH